MFYQYTKYVPLMPHSVSLHPSHWSPLFPPDKFTYTLCHIHMHDNVYLYQLRPQMIENLQYLSFLEGIV